ncbi:MAG: hypothetical protein WBB22_02350 [Anaerolineae bacterium]
MQTEQWTEQTVAQSKRDEFEMSELGDLAEELEKAIGRVRKAMAGVTPLEELAGLQEAMAGLAQMGALTEKMQLAAMEYEKAVAELAGEPNWRLEAETEVSKGPSSLMEVQLVADFDLERATEGRQIVSGDEPASEIAGRHGIAVIRELNLLDCQIVGAAETATQDLRLTPEGNVTLKVNEAGELCFEFAPALTPKAPKGDPRWEKADLPSFAPMIDDVRVDLRDVESGEPFRRNVTVHQDELDLEVKLAFRPLN